MPGVAAGQAHMVAVHPQARLQAQQCVGASLGQAVDVPVQRSQGRRLQLCNQVQAQGHTTLAGRYLCQQGKGVLQCCGIAASSCPLQLQGQLHTAQLHPLTIGPAQHAAANAQPVRCGGSGC